MTSSSVNGIEGEEFDRWYPNQHPRVLGVLVALSGDADLARDATDEAFSRAFEQWHRVGSMASPAAWTHRVALNELRRRARRRSMEQRLRWRWVERERPVHVPDPQLWEAVRRLPDRQRQVVALRYVGDLPEAAIAEALGIARGTVASTLSDARRTLAAALPDHLIDIEPTATTEVHHGHA